MSGVTLYDSSLAAGRQRTAFTSGEAPVAVYGLGKMRLPLAAVYADVCGNVVGADIDIEMVEAVNVGDCPVQGEPGLPGLVVDVVDAGSLSAHSEPEVVSQEAPIPVIIVLTLITDDNEPDLSILEAVGEAIGQLLTPGEMVIVESMVPPRTCTDVLTPILEAESGLEQGEYGFAFCPE
jgi:UDP-N-acetyl-D-mannosaminuronic acid dehydrogenase